MVGNNSFLLSVGLFEGSLVKSCLRQPPPTAPGPPENNCGLLEFRGGLWAISVFLSRHDPGEKSKHGLGVRLTQPVRRQMGRLKTCQGCRRDASGRETRLERRSRRERASGNLQLRDGCDGAKQQRGAGLIHTGTEL